MPGWESRGAILEILGGALGDLRGQIEALGGHAGYLWEHLEPYGLTLHVLGAMFGPSVLIVVERVVSLLKTAWGRGIAPLHRE